MEDINLKETMNINALKDVIVNNLKDCEVSLKRKPTDEDLEQILSLLIVTYSILEDTSKYNDDYYYNYLSCTLVPLWASLIINHDADSLELAHYLTVYSGIEVI